MSSFEELHAKVIAVCEAHGMFAPQAEDTREVAMEKIAKAFDYFDQQVRGLTAINLQREADLAFLNGAVVNFQAQKDVVAEIAEKLPRWTEAMAGTASEMISSLTKYHKSAQTVQPQIPQRSEPSQPYKEPSASTCPEYSHESSRQALGVSSPC